MKKIFSLISLILMIFVSYSQNNLEEVVYLKNGSVIRGIIIEQIPNQTLKIQTKDGSVFVYKLDEVEKITKEAPYLNPSKTQTIQSFDKPITNIQSENTTIKSSITDTINNVQKNAYTYNTPTNKKEYLKKGFLGVTEIGALFAAKNYGSNKALFSLNQLLARRTSQTFSIGMAFGVDVDKNVVFVPVTVDTRIYFIKKRVTPFLNLAPGYAFLHSLEKGFNYYYTPNYHAFITNFGLGVEFKINKGLGVSLNVGGRLTYIPAQNVDLIGGNGFLKFGIVY